VKEDELQNRSDSKELAFKAGVRAKAEAQELLIAAASLALSMPGATAEFAELKDRANVKAQQASELFSKSIYRHEAITSYVIALLKSHSNNSMVEVFVANLEADTQIAHAFNVGYVHFVIAEDSDFISHGVDALFGGIKRKHITGSPNMQLSYFQWSEVKLGEYEHSGHTYTFRDWDLLHMKTWSCIRKNDYTRSSPALRSVGPWGAYKIVQKLIQIQQAEPLLSFSDALLRALQSPESCVKTRASAAHEAVMFGLAAFHGQWVYHPATKVPHHKFSQNPQ
jgi:hypothetical protein